MDRKLAGDCIEQLRIYSLPAKSQDFTVQTTYGGCQGDVEMRQLAAQLAKEYPDTNSGASAYARSLQSMIVHEVRSTLLVLMGAVGFVLLIACVNVAHLSIARARSGTGIGNQNGAGSWTSSTDSPDVE